MYRIGLSDSSGAGWHVYRRFSDFFPLDAQVRKILPDMQAVLPSREIIRPLAGLLGMRAAEPSPEFLDERRKGLDAYVKDILRVAGGNKTALWNHPTVLTFFDIPSVVQRDSPASELSCPVPLGEWDREFAKAEALLKDATKTGERAESASARGHDAANYYKHMRRQVNAARKLQQRLQSSLDFFARMEKIDDGRLEAMAGQFQEFAGRIEELVAAQSGSSHFIPSASTTTHTSMTASPRSGPIAKTPVRSSSLNGGMKKNPTPPLAPAPIEAQNNGDQRALDQATILREQDGRLSELSSIIARQRSLGEAIGVEIGTQPWTALTELL